MKYGKYVVEAKRFAGAWVVGVVWAVRPKDFREFLEYVNTTLNPNGETTRVRRLQGDPEAGCIYPEDKLV